MNRPSGRLALPRLTPQSPSNRAFRDVVQALLAAPTSGGSVVGPGGPALPKLRNVVTAASDVRRARALPSARASARNPGMASARASARRSVRSTKSSGRDGSRFQGSSRSSRRMRPNCQIHEPTTIYMRHENLPAWASVDSLCRWTEPASYELLLNMSAILSEDDFRVSAFHGALKEGAMIPLMARIIPTDDKADLPVREYWFCASSTATDMDVTIATVVFGGTQIEPNWDLVCHISLRFSTKGSTEGYYYSPSFNRSFGESGESLFKVAWNDGLEGRPNFWNWRQEPDHHPLAHDILDRGDVICVSVFKLSHRVTLWNEREGVHVLCIGADAYASARLYSCVADAARLAGAFRAVGARVTFVKDPDRSELYDVVRWFVKSVWRHKPKIVFVYFAGYAIQVDNKNYLVPVDAEVEIEADADTDCKDFDWLVRAVHLRHPGPKAFIIDACRENPFPDSKQWDTKVVGLAEMQLVPPNTMLAMSASPGKTSLPTAAGKNGLYAIALSRFLFLPGVSMVNAIADANGAVYDASSGQQIPWSNASKFEQEVFCSGISEKLDAPVKKNQKGRGRKGDGDDQEEDLAATLDILLPREQLERLNSALRQIGASDAPKVAFPIIQAFAKCYSERHMQDMCARPSYHDAATVQLALAALRVAPQAELPAILHCVATLCKNIENASVIGGQGGITSVLDLMKGSSTNCLMQEKTSGAVWALTCSNQESRKIAYEHDAVNLLIKALQVFPNSPTLTENVCGAISWICTEFTVADEDTALKAASYIISAMSEHSTSKEVNVQTVSALGSLCCQEVISESIAEDGGVRLVHQALEDHMWEAEVVEECCLAFQRFCSFEANKTEAGGSVLMTILTAMRQHQNSETVLLRACGALKTLIVRHSGNQQCVMDFGGLDLLINVMQQHAENAALHVEVSSVLRNLSVSDSSKELIGQKCLSSLLTSMSSHDEDARLQEMGCACIKNLAVHPENKDALFQRGAVGHIMRVVRALPQDLAFQLQALSALRNMATNHDKTRKAVAELGGAQTILDVIQAHILQAPIVSRGCWLIRVLAQYPPNRALFGEAGLNIVSEVLKSHSEDNNVQDMGLWALWSLILKSPANQSVVGANTIKMIIDAMDIHLEFSRVQENACGCLWAIAKQLENKFIVGQRYSGVVQIFKAMDYHSSEPGVQERACGALKTLFLLGKNQESVSEADVQLVIDAMEAHEGEARVQENGCWALGNLALSAQQAVVIGRLDGAKLILGAMSEHAGDIRVQKKACAALARLSQVEGNKTRMSDLGTPACLVKSMATHATDAEIHFTACATLHHLATQRENKETLARQGVIPVALDSMAQHSQNTRVQLEVCRFFSQLSLSEPNLRLIGVNGCNAILSSMQLHSTHVDIQIAACAALAHLALDETNCESMGASDAISVMLKCMERHQDSTELVLNALMALRNLATHRENQRLIGIGGVGTLQVLQLIENHSASVPVLMEACAVLRNMAVHEDNQMILGAQGGIEVLLTILNQHPRQPALHAVALSALCNFSSSGENAKLLREEKVVRDILESMFAHDHEAAVQEFGCWLLANIVGNPTVRDRVLELGALNLVVEGLHRHHLSERVCEEACRALMYFSKNEDAKEWLVETGGLIDTIEAMRHHFRCQGIQEFGCCVLMHASSDPDIRKILKKAETKKVVEAARRRFPDDKALLDASRQLSNALFLTL